MWGECEQMLVQNMEQLHPHTGNCHQNVIEHSTTSGQNMTELMYTHMHNTGTVDQAITS